MTGDLDTLIPQPRRVPFRGREVEVHPLRLNQVSAFASATKGIIGRALLAAQLLEEGQSLSVGAVIYDALETDMDSLVRALALVTGEPEADIGEATMPEVIDLVEAVVEVNHDFFARRLPAALERLRPLVPAPKPSAAPAQATTEPPADGSTSPSTSSSTDTGSETS